MTLTENQYQKESKKQQRRKVALSSLLLSPCPSRKHIKRPHTLSSLIVSNASNRGLLDFPLQQITISTILNLLLTTELRQTHNVVKGMLLLLFNFGELIKFVLLWSKSFFFVEFDSFLCGKFCGVWLFWAKVWKFESGVCCLTGFLVSFFLFLCPPRDFERVVLSRKSSRWLGVLAELTRSKILFFLLSIC